MKLANEVFGPHVTLVLGSQIEGAFRVELLQGRPVDVEKLAAAHRELLFDVASKLVDEGVATWDEERRLVPNGPPLPVIPEEPEVN